MGPDSARPANAAWERALWAIQHQTVDLPAQQALWAAGVAESAMEFGIPIDLRVLAPVLSPADDTTVVPRPWVYVVPDHSDDLTAVRTACACVWRRATHLDTDAEFNEALDGGTVEAPSIRGDGVFIDFDTLDDVNPWSVKACTCLHMLLTALKRRDLTAVRVCNGVTVPGEGDYHFETLLEPHRTPTTLTLTFRSPLSRQHGHRSWLRA